MILYCQVAVQAGNDNCVYDFLNAGVYPNVTDYQEKAAIHIANESSDTLLPSRESRGARIDAAPKSGLSHTVHIHHIMSHKKDKVSG